MRGCRSEEGGERGASRKDGPRHRGRRVAGRRLPCGASASDRLRRSRVGDMRGEVALRPRRAAAPRRRAAELPGYRAAGPPGRHSQAAGATGRPTGPLEGPGGPAWPLDERCDLGVTARRRRERTASPTGLRSRHPDGQALGGTGRPADSRRPPRGVAEAAADRRHPQLSLTSSSRQLPPTTSGRRPRGPERRLSSAAEPGAPPLPLPHASQATQARPAGLARHALSRRRRAEDGRGRQRIVAARRRARAQEGSRDAPHRRRRYGSAPGRDLGGRTRRARPRVGRPDRHR